MQFKRLLVPLAGALALLSLLIALVSTSSPDSLLPLERDWRYRFGDSPLGESSSAPAWATRQGLQSSGWLPQQALTPPPGREGADMLWLSLRLPPQARERPAVYFANLGMSAVEAFLDGRLVYRSGRIHPGSMEYSTNLTGHLIRLPSTAPGQRLVLRLQSHGPVLGAVQGAWYDEAEVLERWVLRTTLPHWSIGSFVTVSGLLLLVLLPLWRRDERSPRLLGLFCASSGLALVFQTELPALAFGPSRLWFLSSSLATAVALPVLVHFVDRAILTQHPRWLRLAYLASYALGACMLLLLGLNHTSSLPFYFFWLTVQLGLLAATVVLVARDARAGNLEARYFLISLALLLAGILASIASGLGLLDLPQTSGLLGFLGFTLTLLMLVGRRFISLLERSRQHAELLEAREREVLRMSREVADGTGRLSSAVQQMRETASAQARTIDAQRLSLHETQTTVEQIRQTSQLASQKSRAVLEDAERAEGLGRSGAAALEATLAGLDAIRREVEEVARRLGALEERTHEVADIVEAVKDMADQSNLLAINASIEAARSGEHGQGFAVVANEMRSLADQSIRATLRIRQVLAAVDEEVRGSASLSRRGQERVQAAVEQVRTSGQQLRELARIVTDSGASVRQIAASVGQQHHGVEQLTLALHSFAQQMRQVLERLEQTQAAASSVQQVAEQLERSIEQSSSALPLSALAPNPAPGSPS